MAKKAANNQIKLIHDDSPIARRQPKTDLLILARLLRDEGTKQFQDEDHVVHAHEVLVRWADLETSGRLAELTERQMQGSFLAEVFGDALGYTIPFEGAETFYQLQEQTIAPGQTPDAILGKFQQGGLRTPMAVVELKGPAIHLDRDRSSGRTAVDQSWDYLVNTPTSCRWAIVSNIVSFRLYERDSTKRKYEHFTLQELRDRAAFRRFYALMHRHGLIQGILKEPPRAVRLLKETNERQREVSDTLYESYSEQRLRLISELHQNQQLDLKMSVVMAQRLLDRIIFIAFCEDRNLLPENTIQRAWSVQGFSRAVNPRWQSFKDLFHFINVGSPQANIPRYNGGLFKEHEVDNLELADEWTNFFKNVGTFDFRDEVNLDVLGHLFERSITELERLKETGVLLGNLEKQEQYAQMPQSVKRKQLGIYYTPPELTLKIVQYTIEELINERFTAAAIKQGISKSEARQGIVPDEPDFWRECLSILRNLKVVDPACGSGAFLFQAYTALEQFYFEVIGHLEQLGEADTEQLANQVPHYILNDNLYGVDLSPEAVEITQLALWIRSATREQPLATLSQNIVHGNSLVHNPAVHSAAFDWRVRFPEVFDREEAGFDCVIGNPPWERIKLQEREFFSLPKPEIATATNAAKRRQLIEKLEKEDADLYEKYRQALAGADTLLTYCRKSDHYPLTGKGDINLYAVFAELAYQIVAPHGRVGLLTPSGIASDKTTKDYFAAIAETNRLIRLYDFENKKVFFPEVHASFKFCILNFGGVDTKTKQADFAFFIHGMEELEDKQRHVRLSGEDIRLLNPNTRTCPIFRTRRDAEITKRIYERVPVLIDRNREGPTGNPWDVKFGILFHQAKDASRFTTAEELVSMGYSQKGNLWKKGKKSFVPCYEAKMARQYDHRAAGVRFELNWTRQGQPTESSLIEHLNPEFLPMPRWWADAEEVTNTINDRESLCLFSFRKVTSPTNTRTLLAAFLPLYGAIDSLQFIFFNKMNARLRCCLMANSNSFVLDYLLRQKIGNVNVNYYLVEQLPFATPDTYSKKCTWNKRQTLETWISERVLKLTCTAVDMLPLAEACDFSSGSYQQEYGGRLNKWDDAERAQMMAELDAAYFHLYGINRDDAEYILSTFKGIHDQTPLLEGSQSTAEHILKLYDEFAG